MSINLSLQSMELCTFNRDTARLNAMAFEMPGIAQSQETVVSEKPSGITSRIDIQDEAIAAHHVAVFGKLNNLSAWQQGLMIFKQEFHL